MLCGGKSEGGWARRNTVIDGLDTEVESGLGHPGAMSSRMKARDAEIFGN